MAGSMSTTGTHGRALCATTRMGGFRWMLASIVRLQRGFRMRRDARVGAAALREQSAAAKVLQKTMRSRSDKIARRLKQRFDDKQASAAQAKLDATANEMDNETAELLLDAFAADQAAEKAAENGDDVDVANTSAISRPKLKLTRRVETPRPHPLWRWICCCVSGLKSPLKTGNESSKTLGNLDVTGMVRA